jgi:DNA-binding NarL/FixJ family response regulator
VEMPDGDGVDLAAQIRREFPGVQVILVSGHRNRQYQRLARDAGALAFIPKATLSLDALRQALQEGG